MTEAKARRFNVCILPAWSTFCKLSKSFSICLQTDPFNRSLLTVDMLIPDHDLKKRINEYLASHSKH